MQHDDPGKINDARFPASLRIKSQKDFQRVFQEGKVAADGTLVVHAVRIALDQPTTDPQTQLGLSISKRVGSAPVRNRWKRLIREAFRQQKGTLPSGLLIVVRPKKGAEPDFRLIWRSLPALLKRLERKLG